MTTGELPQTLGRLAEATRIASRTLLSLDTNPVPADWRHITKVDPENAKKLPVLFPLYLQHTSAVSVGGSRDVNAHNTAETFDLLSWTPTPAFHEPSAPEHVTTNTRKKAEFLAIPEVLNGDTESLVGKLGSGIEHIRDELVPSLLAAKLPVALPDAVERRVAAFATSWLLSEAVFEAYIIQNVDSAAARESGVTADDRLTPTAAKHRAMAAERHLGSKVVYLEYSGTFGGEEAADILRAIREGVSWSRIWYGGGLDSADAANAMLDAGADAVVVGNVFHEVADDEAEIARRATEAFDAVPTRDDLRTWVESAVDVSETAGARYLSTIPSVHDPEQRATDYLVDSLYVWLAFDAVGEETDPTGIEARWQAATGRSPDELLPPESHRRGAFVDSDVDDEGRELAREYLREVLDARFGGENALPGDHLSLPTDE
jgi:phosphoglycerol geranylgeranyltransferase